MLASGLLLWGSPASASSAAAADDGPSLRLETDAYVAAGVLTVTATATPVDDVARITTTVLALQAAGAETYIDNGIPFTVPLAAAPAAVRLDAATVQWQWPIRDADSAITISWSAEALRDPTVTPGAAMCAGTFVRSGRVDVKQKSC